MVVIPFSEARIPEGAGLAMLKLGCLWVSWVDWPERQMGPGFWVLGSGQEGYECVCTASASRVGELARKSRWRGTGTFEGRGRE